MRSASQKLLYRLSYFAIKTGKHCELDQLEKEKKLDDIIQRGKPSLEKRLLRCQDV